MPPKSKKPVTVNHSSNVARRSKAEKPRILLGACGSACAVRFDKVCRKFVEWAQVKAVITKSALRFVSEGTLPSEVSVYHDEKEWTTWKKLGDPVLHIELCNWADIMVIAPLSPTTLAKISGGLCDNLLTNIVRAWDAKNKLLFVAPSMNSCMWKHIFTEEHLNVIDDELGIILIPPVPVKATNGEELERAMAEPSAISSLVKAAYMQKMEQMKKEANAKKEADASSTNMMSP